MQDQFQDPQRGNLAGIILMCLGVVALCLNDALAKSLMERYAPLQVLFMRNLIAFPVTILIALRMGGVAALRSRRPLTHLLRGVLWIVATMMFFTSLMHLGLAEATALIFVGPFFITVLSALVLREPVGPRRWMAVAVGFIGVLVIVQPGAATFRLVSLLPVATALVYAVLMLSARWVDPRESVWTLLLYLTGAGLVLSLVIVPFVWVPVLGADLWRFVAIAVVGTTGMTLMTQAFRIASPVVVAPLDYTGLIWATLLGMLIWHEMPGPMVYLGAAIIIASGIFTILREHRRKGTAVEP